MLKRALSAVGAALLIGGTVVIVVNAPAASALTQKRLTISQSHPVVDADFPPIPASFEESTTAVTPTPSGCGNPDGTPDSDNPPPFGAMCDDIPFRIVIPTDIAPSDDYIVQVVLSWDDAAGSAGGQGGLVTDLDLHYFDNGQLALRADKTDTGDYTEMTSSAGSTIPESVKLGDPDLVDYNIVAVNAGAGPSTGYHIHAEMKIAKAEKIFELLADQPKKATDDSTNDTLPPDLSNVPLPSIGDLPTTDFAAGDFTDLTNAPLEDALRTNLPTAEVVGVSKPSPVSGMTVALALAVVPAVGVGFLLWFARRRNEAARLI